MFLIIAYTGHHAAEAARRLELRPEQWKYVFDRSDLLGVDRSTIVLVVEGSWKRKDWRETDDYLRSRHLQVWYEVDFGRPLGTDFSKERI